ncbi:SLBB domain-containing protein [Candidatus Fermentibacterales bacterium]|nr:SLBB domain-containing protein [Candidatus Fermentibacterales bacterium]
MMGTLWSLAAMVMAVSQLPVSAPGMSGSQSLDETLDRDEYVVGPGDLITVVVEGGCTGLMLSTGLSPMAQYRVSNDGVLAVSGVGQVTASGLTLNALEAELQAVARRSYPRTVLRVSLAAARTVRVRISGTVMQPGIYELLAIQRVSALVDSAHGLAPHSSHLGLMLLEDGLAIEVDLMTDPETGRFVSDPYLPNGAVVLFEPCLHPVYVVSFTPGHPGWTQAWDLTEPANLECFLARTGGLGGRVDLTSSVLLRGNERIPIWTEGLGFTEIAVQTGDTLTLQLRTEYVTVSGAVNLPGNIPFDPTLSVEEYIALAGGPVSTAAIGGTRTLRNGEEIESDSSPLEIYPARGDVIEVPHSWVTRNQGWISLALSAVSMAVLITTSLR